MSDKLRSDIIRISNFKGANYLIVLFFILGYVTREESMEFMSQQFPAMYKTSEVTSGGQKVVCTPEVSLYQYNSELGTTRLEDKGHTELGLPSSGGSGDSATGSTSSTSGFQCGFCGKTFQQKNTFQNHLRSHREGEDPYQCDICGKTFAGTSTLNYTPLQNF